MLQLNAKLKSLIAKLWDRFWSGGISNPLSAIEQITYLLFMKQLDELDVKREKDAQFTGDTYTSRFSGSFFLPQDRDRAKELETPKPNETAAEKKAREQELQRLAIDKATLRWSHFKQMKADEMLPHVQQKVFPFIKDLNGDGSTFTRHMANAVFIIPSANLLQGSIQIIEDIFVEIELDAQKGIHLFQDIQGDVYEMLLSEISTAGKNGQFRTPRHIIKLVSELVNPQLGHRICDPACGTAGFLLDAYQYIVTQLAKQKVKEGQTFPPDEDGFIRTSVSGQLTHLATLIADPGTDADFLAHFFRFSSPARLINDAAYPSIRLSDISAWEVPFPLLDEQKRIAAVLDKADALRRQRQKSLLLTEGLLQSVFIEMFGDPVANPKDFPVRKLGDFFSSPKEGAKCGPFGSALKKSDSQQTGVPVWGIDNISTDGRFVEQAFTRISSKKYEDLKSYETTNGDILISRAGTVGKMCVVSSAEKNGIIGSNLIRLRLNADLLSPHWFVAFMKYCKGRVARLRAGPDGAFTHMSTKILQGLEFPYPSPDLQNKFLKVCGAAEVVSESATGSEHHLGRLFSSLQQRAFRGELDLSRLVLADHVESAKSKETASAVVIKGRYKRPGSFIAPPEIETLN